MPSTAKYSVKSNLNDFLNTLFGTMPSNYFQEPHPQCQDAFYLSTKKKSKRYTTSSKNI